MLNRPFDPETRIVSRAEQPPMLERGCDLLRRRLRRVGDLRRDRGGTRGPRR